jgi:hypothetical protein
LWKADVGGRRIHLRSEVIVSKLLLIAGALFIVPGPLLAASSGDDCAVLDIAFRQARTEFPTLKNRQFGGALCRYKSKEFTCEWGFPTDRYGDAETQIGRLERCTAAQPNAQLVEKKSHGATFQIDPDTRVRIQGPVPYSGDWAIELKITTTADWN